MTRRSKVPATATPHVFATAAAALLIMTIGSGCNVSAFSLMRTSAMQGRHRSIHTSSSSGPTSIATTRRLPPVQMSKPARVDREHSIGTDIRNPVDPSLSFVQEQREPEKKSTNPTPVLISMLRDLGKKIQSGGDSTIENENKNGPRDDGIGRTTTNPCPQWMVMAFAALALAFLPLQDANAAMSGGRMGGSFSSEPQSTTISRPAPVRSYSSYNRGYTAGYISRPGLTIAPTIGYGYGGYGGYGYGGGLGHGGGYGYRSHSFFPTPILLAFFLGPLLLWSSSATKSLTTASSPLLDGLSGSDSYISALGPGTSVVQLSVALEVPDRDDPGSILSALDRLAKTSRTDSRFGIQKLSSEVALEILRKRSSIISANSSTKHFRDRPKALREFENRSVTERSKFETETLSKFGGVDYTGAARGVRTGETSNGKATMAVITLILAIDGDSTKLNRINTASDVEQALQRIAADAKVGDCLQSVEILWTPEDRSETLSIREVVVDYPELRSV